MVWGAAPRGLEDVVARLRANDPRLTSLSILRFRRLEEQDVAGLCDALAANTALAELSVACHPVPPAAAARFGAALAANAALRSVSVGDSSLGDAGLAAMAEGLAANRGLTHLDCEHKGLTAAGAHALRRCLEAHPALESLTLSRNDLGTAGAAALCVPWRALRRLDLSSCGLGADAVAALATAPSLGTLTRLDLSGNALGPGAGGPLAALVRAARRLEALALRDAGLGPDGVSALAGALPGAASLTSLDLGGCRMGPDGAAALAAALAGGSSEGARLTQLVLGPGNGLDDAAVEGLAKALGGAAEAPRVPAAANSGGGGAAAGGAPGPRGLHLDLSDADVDAPGARALAAAADLRGLSLFGASLSDAAVAAVVEALGGGGGGGAAAAGPPAGFAGLEELNIAGCRLGLPALMGVVRALGAAPEGARPLRLVEVGANPGADEPEFQEAAAALRDARPGLDVHWRAADGSSEGAGGGPPGGGALRPALP